jgi:hypothetical protein
MIYKKNVVLIFAPQLPAEGVIDDLIKKYERGEISALNFFFPNLVADTKMICCISVN